MAKNSYWKSYGGKPGLTFLIEEFKDQLNKKGLGEYFRWMFYANPKKIFTFC
jgi:phosphotriesterase-related protein